MIRIKTIFFSALISLGLSMASSADTTTPRLGLIDPTPGSAGWASKMTHNFNVLDSSTAILSSTQTFTAPVIFTSSISFSTATFSRVLIDTVTYSGSDVLAVYGTSRFQNSIFACDTNWQNCGSLDESSLILDNGPTSASINILHDGSVGGGMLLRAAGTYINTTSNSPAPLYAKTVVVSPNWYTAGTASETPSDSENALEYAVLVGTAANMQNSKLVVFSSPAYAYHVWIGTSTDTNFKTFAISTSGVVSINNVAYRWPSTDSTGDRYLKNDGDGNLTWETTSGLGGSGGSSSLAVFEDSVKVSSPTAIVKFDGTDFDVSLTGGATAFVVLGDSITVTGLTLSSMTVRSIYWADGTVQVSSPTAGGGSGMSPGATYYVQLNPSGQQSGSFYVESSSATDYYGTAATFQGAVGAGQFYAGTASPLYRLDIQGDSGLGVSSPLSNFAYTGNGNSIRAITTGNAASAFFSNTSAGSSASALKVQKTSGEAPAAEFIVVGSTAIYVNGGFGTAINVAFGQTKLKETTIESWSTHVGSSTFVSTMTLSGGYVVQNVPPSTDQVLKFNGTVWAPGTDGGSGGAPSNSILLKDSDGILWSVNLQTTGNLTTTSLGAQSFDPEPIQLVDSNSDVWNLTVTTSGALNTELVP